VYFLTDDAERRPFFLSEIQSNTAFKTFKIIEALDIKPASYYHPTTEQKLTPIPNTSINSLYLRSL
jgi:hypothetical protein